MTTGDTVWVAAVGGHEGAWLGATWGQGSSGLEPGWLRLAVSSRTLVASRASLN
ncbi:hypothetical protein I79_003368 [Cricetulus griseus]|uniref:Uncharacterized protein n=1 Tax=Cricetulus griseus TaxID=10029 RepID=G3GZS1_CRIGR|nr:hypothetical protein I79_003368 [Cricetulus griseus]